MKNTSYFNWMRQYRWTIRQIKNTFGVPSPIARQIQSLFCEEAAAKSIAAAHHELCNGQVGF